MATKSSRFQATAAFVVGLLLCLLTTDAVAQDPDDEGVKGTAELAPAAAQLDRHVVLHFHDVAVEVLAQFFHELTRKPYVVEGGRWERLDLFVEPRLTVDEAERAFAAALDARGYRVVSEDGAVRIVPPRVAAMRVEGSVASLPSEPLTLGKRERFVAVCTDRGSWIQVHGPERACGLSWARQPPDRWYVFLPWLRRVRRIDEGAQTHANAFGLPVSLRELFDVVCQTGDVAPEHASLITIDRRGPAPIPRGDELLPGVIEGAAHLGCRGEAETPEPET